MHGAVTSDNAPFAPLPPMRPSELGPIARPSVGVDRWTAVYDISAHAVYLPDGTRLEAHSGLGDRLDDPRFVSERDRGATPPGVYELTLRESLFHGVQALRLTPLGDGDVFGRSGLLAHPYMLGPSGDSNGCVSFKDYDAFLRAFQNGQVKRLSVVARRNEEVAHPPITSAAVSAFARLVDAIAFADAVRDRLVRETIGYLRRTFSRLDVTSRSRLPWSRRVRASPRRFSNWRSPATASCPAGLDCFADRGGPLAIRCYCVFRDADIVRRKVFTTLTRIESKTMHASGCGSVAT